MLKNLHDEVEENFDIDDIYEECLHIKCAKPVIMERNLESETIEESACSGTDHWDHTYEQPKTKVDIYGVNHNNTIVCVRWEAEDNTSYHIIRVVYTKPEPELTCITCKTSTCIHCKEVLHQDVNATELPVNILQALNRTTKWRSRYIPTSVSNEPISFSCPPEEQKANRCIIKDDGDCIHLKPTDVGTCQCGGHWGEANYQDNIKVYTENNIISAKVYTRHCVECNTYKEYDGSADQILNMGTYMVSHGILRDFLRQFVTQGCTMASYYKQWCWRQVESGNLNFLEECPYNRFRYAWYCFLQLLDIHYEEGFLCPICSDIPDIVVMDGVSLGIRKSFMPWGPSLFSSVDSVVYDGSSHNTRNFINNNETRQLLKKYIDKGLTYEEMMTLKKKVALYQPSLSPLLDYFFNNSDYISPHMYKDFFYLLSSNYPVCAFLHYSEDLFNILNNLETFSVDDMVLIERESPVISVLFKQLGWKIPENLKPIFRELVCKAKSPFNGQRHEVSRCDSNCNCTSKGFFPCLPKLCHRGNYVMDNKNKKRNSSCTKKRSTHPSLIPGLFTISCIHGICYGYDVMEDSESPNVPFTILRTRLHDGCHKGYNLDCYPQHRHINTQVAEQRNSTFKKLKSMLSEFGKL